MGNLVESCGGKKTLRAGLHCAENCAICERCDGAVYDRKKWNVKWKNFVLHKLNIFEILYFTRRCYDETCKNEKKNIGIAILQNRNHKNPV